VKTCIRCGVDKSEALFGKDRQRKDGLAAYCKECHNAARRQAYLGTDKVAHRARVAKWRSENVDRARELERAGHQRNKEKRNAESIAYRAANRDKTRALCRKWAKDNAAKMRATNADRRAKKNKAIPAWGDSEFDKLVMAEAYDLAKMRSDVTSVPWHVDHIVPLRSDRVYGLHCAANLQVIPAVMNHIKGNRNWPDM
jgi:hypothetical protein